LPLWGEKDGRRTEKILRATNRRAREENLGKWVGTELQCNQTSCRLKLRNGQGRGRHVARKKKTETPKSRGKASTSCTVEGGGIKTENNGASLREGEKLRGNSKGKKGVILLTAVLLGTGYNARRIKAGKVIVQDVSR